MPRRHKSRLFLLRARIAAALLRVVAYIPRPLAMGLATLLGQLAWLFRHPMRVATEVNLARAMPDMDEPARRSMARASLLEDFRGGIEIARAWCRPDQAFSAIQGVEGSWTPWMRQLTPVHQW